MGVVVLCGGGSFMGVVGLLVGGFKRAWWLCGWWFYGGMLDGFFMRLVVVVLWRIEWGFLDDGSFVVGGGFIGGIFYLVVVVLLGFRYKKINI